MSETDYIDEEEEEEDNEYYIGYNEDYFKDDLDEYDQTELTEKFKIALKKKEDEETQKEVEMALLALCNTEYYKLGNELYFDWIKEIIKHHQEYHNLTQLAYLSAWYILSFQLPKVESLEATAVKELHFGRKAAKAMEDLSKCVDWKRKKEGKKEKEVKEASIIEKWLYATFYYLSKCKLWNEEFTGLIGSNVGLFRASKENYGDICYERILSLNGAAKNENVKIDSLLMEGAVDLFAEEMKQSTLKEGDNRVCLDFFLSISRRLEGMKDDEKEEEERKTAKRKMFEKLEEDGYEDCVVKFLKLGLNYMFGDDNTVITIEDFFMHL
ncbi:uncharacterized protein MONOS_1839 [Monocercomonoides exilis]|uniref:uncharacterized protein n=1 Tax=Monocercomonoides exilis TaxID=2049356 RepID=UPI00355A9AF8|nr:hypothetical protein MONOS_1839 [Monocercomonoides exilis]|eukprot:MONOS_1839.1-p1 / transcript=MONOS_1839.1 / gene=MONOS_1839 / organism=Monocercomonoides_exilis_PA203 / gene_product=unspecified product / transcript_product=unspecified product / location=Mono_scaffold00035:3012-4522(+) / protein_length=326 / sequence_SO=supercontig / SO=protein_coding / is_pseudo=false